MALLTKTKSATLIMSKKPVNRIFLPSHLTIPSKSFLARVWLANNVQMLPNASKVNNSVFFVHNNTLMAIRMALTILVRWDFIWRLRR